VTESGTHPSEPATARSDEALERALADALDTREAVAFVHVGSSREPSLSYCRPSLPAGYHAIAFDGRQWCVHSGDAVSTGPAAELTAELADTVGTGSILAPSRLPHDAALYLEDEGFSLTSSDVVERARATKTANERERIASAQGAASAGVRRAAAMLDDATAVDGRLVADDEVLTASRLRAAVDEAIVEIGGFPAGNTGVFAGSDGRIGVGEPVVISATPVEATGYHGGLTRTFVVDGDGGAERRAHVGVTQSFRSAAAMLTADERSVAAVEADLAAEVRAFGFDERDGIDVRVAGIGLDAYERPWRPNHEIGPNAVVRLSVSVGVGTGRIALADLLAVGADGVDWFAAPSRSLDPAAVRA
jgi:hypothetical protein